MFVWLKKVFVNKRRPLVYFKTKPINSWSKLPEENCPKGGETPVVQDRNKECAEGWKIGKMIARTITYLTIMQGKELTESLINDSGRVKAENHWNGRKNGPTGAKVRAVKAQTRVDMDAVSDIISSAIMKTSRCIKQGLSHYTKGNSVKKICILKAMKKESNSLIEEIIEGAVLHGFKCDYEALKMGKCRKMKQIAKEMDKGKVILSNLRSF